MSRPPRSRLRQPPHPAYVQQYSAVPQSTPQSPQYRPQPQVAPFSPSKLTRKPVPQLPDQQQSYGIARGVASGEIGGNYGPYSYHPSEGRRPSRKRFSAQSDISMREKPLPIPEDPDPPRASSSMSQDSFNEKTGVYTTATVPQFLWNKDPEPDDPLHDPRAKRKRWAHPGWTPFSCRGWSNALALLIILVGLLVLFVGYPVITYVMHHQAQIHGFNLGGINASGQIPEFVNFPSLVDKDTPDSVKTRTGSDGKRYNLVFSDEFNEDGRSFYPGDDPFWEAADLHYWATGDLEWYDPQAITTQDGKLVITISKQKIHDLDYMSGMLTSWNKLCFTTGYLEVSVSMPGSSRAAGLWPGAWTMGNLGRAGYGATTDGTWPYSYDTCDLGTFPNQTAKDGTPAAAATGSPEGGPLSFLPGQRLSSCTCPGSDHPGPSTDKGRGVPEVDILEGQIDTSIFQGAVSQSFQTAPYNYQYDFVNTTPTTTIFDTSKTTFNTYKGGVFQQALSAVTYIDSATYDGQSYSPYGIEVYSNPSHRDQGFVTWYSAGGKTWSITADAVGPDTTSQVDQRLLPEEPMYIILNLGMAESFQKQDFAHLVFPSKMYVDYVRLYQREGTEDGLTCDPPSHPTANYINSHIEAYMNPNLTTWAQAGYTFPRNSKYDGC